MKNPIALSLVALVASLVALGSILVQGATDPAGGAATSEGATVSRDTVAPDLAARVESLAAENAVLRDRIAMLETAPVAAERTVDTSTLVPRDEFDAFRDEVMKALEGETMLAASASKKPDAFKEQVAQALQEVRHKETAEKWQSGVQKRVDAIDETMPKIERWLELTPDQSSSMRTALLAQYERQQEYIRQWEAGADDEIIGELKTADNEALRTELSGFLSPEQLERYTRRGRGGK